MFVAVIVPLSGPFVTSPPEKSQFVPNVRPTSNTIPEPSPKIIPFPVNWYTLLPVNSCAPEKNVPAGNVWPDTKLAPAPNLTFSANDCSVANEVSAAYS